MGTRLRPCMCAVHASVWSYKLSGTETAYGATRCAVLTYGERSTGIRYCARVWCYGACGTEIAYGHLLAPLHGP
eukprot:1505539-Rhodomonas_salina.1